MAVVIERVVGQCCDRVVAQYAVWALMMKETRIIENNDKQVLREVGQRAVHACEPKTRAVIAVVPAHRALHAAASPHGRARARLGRC